MKVTGITAQQKSPNRVNVFIDGSYRFSLDVFQVTELGIRVGKEYDEAELAWLVEESAFGKLYGRALEYIMLRPHSGKEIKDYLWRKTLNKTKITRKGDEYVKKEIKGVSKEVANRVFDRLADKGYIDDEKFARFWIENRQQSKGISRRKLEMELIAKGVDRTIIEDVMQNSPRDEKSEIEKVISKKAKRYSDENKLIAYLLQQGFNYDVIKEVLSGD